jgi:hypothetical protein
MLPKNHIIVHEKEEIRKKMKNMKRDFPELFSKEELQIEIDNKIKLKQHSKNLLKYIKTQNKEKTGNPDTTKKLQKALKDLLK